MKIPLYVCNSAFIITWLKRDSLGCYARQCEAVMDYCVGPLWGHVDTDGSGWMIDDGALIITMEKEKENQWWEDLVDTKNDTE